MNQSDAEIKAFRHQWNKVADQIVINEYSSRGGALESFEDVYKKIVYLASGYGNKQWFAAMGTRFMLF